MPGAENVQDDSQPGRVQWQLQLDVVSVPQELPTDGAGVALWKTDAA